MPQLETNFTENLSYLCKNNWKMTSSLNSSISELFFKLIPNREDNCSRRCFHHWSLRRSSGKCFSSIATYLRTLSWNSWKCTVTVIKNSYRAMIRLNFDLFPWIEIVFYFLKNCTLSIVENKVVVSSRMQGNVRLEIAVESKRIGFAR